MQDTAGGVNKGELISDVLWFPSYERAGFEQIKESKPRSQITLLDSTNSAMKHLFPPHSIRCWQHFLPVINGEYFENLVVLQLRVNFRNQLKFFEQITASYLRRDQIFWSIASKDVVMIELRVLWEEILKPLKEISKNTLLKGAEPNNGGLPIILLKSTVEIFMLNPLVNTKWWEKTKRGNVIRAIPESTEKCSKLLWILKDPINESQQQKSVGFEVLPKLKKKEKMKKKKGKEVLGKEKERR